MLELVWHKLQFPGVIHLLRDKGQFVLGMMLVREVSERLVGDGKKRGEENLTKDTPSQKEGLALPSSGTFSAPLGCRCSVFPVQKSTTERTPESFSRGVQAQFGRVRSLVHFPPPIHFAPPPLLWFKEGVRVG